MAVRATFFQFIPPFWIKVVDGKGLGLRLQDNEVHPQYPRMEH